MNDKTLRQDVIDELNWDPSIDSANIGVAVDNGVVTLTGHVANYAQKFAAEKAAQRVKGVKALAQDIEVRYAGVQAHADDQIAARAVSVLDWDVIVPNAVKVKVSQGWITLSGEVDWEYQRRTAEADMRKLAGVKGVSNTITIKARVLPSDVSTKIHDALRRYADLEASGVRISIDAGKVKLEGKVHSWRERNAIEQAAWAAPGVKAVDDRVMIS